MATPLHEHGEHEPTGIVTSGTPSPTLGVPIAMAYVPPDDAEVGTMVEVGIRAPGSPRRSCRCRSTSAPS